MNSMMLFLSILGFVYNLSDNTVTNTKNTNISYVKNIEKKIIYNNEIVKLFRFERDETINYNNERISIVISDDGKLLGYGIFNIKNHMQIQEKLPTKEESEEIAMVFIKKVAPEIINNMKVLWIKPHDEVIMYKGKRQTITGMKVKCKDLATGLYFWVIIGTDKQIMVFERNIKWIVFPGKRGTEKWLDDDWVVNHNSF